jgi:hypothetical protein
MHKTFSQENFKGVDICKQSEVTVSLDLILVWCRVRSKSNFQKIESRNGLFVNTVVIIRGHPTAGNFLTS